MIFADDTLFPVIHDKRSSTEKLYQELGIEHLRSRGCFRKLCLFCKIIKSRSPPYLFNLIPSKIASMLAENKNTVVRTLLFGRTDFTYSTNKEIINTTISFILTTE